MLYEFQSTAHRNLSEMSRAIAEEWLSAGGANSESQQREFLAESSDSDLADEAINAWDLRGEWAQAREFDRADLVEAFADLRKALTQ